MTRHALERNEADRRLVDATRQARGLLTWQEIADGVGVSRQAAEQRLGTILRRRGVVRGLPRTRS